MKKSFKQLFCWHNYEPLPPDDEYRKWIRESYHELYERNIKCFSYTLKHVCSKCGKEIILRSEMIY